MAGKKKAVATRKKATKNHAYDPRLATARALSAQISAVGCMAGLMVKAVRDYKVGGKGRQTQSQVAKKAGVSQALLSSLESGSSIPGDSNLMNVLDAIGLDATAPGGAALLALLRYIRDQRSDLEKLAKEPPK